MNKSKINSLVIALVLLVPYLAFALPGAHDPLSGKGYACNSCHTSGSTIGNNEVGSTGYATNVCLRCHSSSGAVPIKSSNKFAPEDYANPFNTVNTTNLPRASALQSSHKWFGSDTVPAAGAVAPADTTLNGLNKNSFFQGSLFCARCHNVHGTSGEQSLSAPYLRYANDTDQMCLNCHRPRDTKDHTVGSHPVNVSYTSASVKAKITGGSLLAAPVYDKNKLTGQVKLIDNKVVCSTCHRTHNTDSRTSTFDPYSSTQTFGQLSSSKGYLLRVDAYGKSKDDINICTNCHSAKKNHNYGLRGAKPAVQCNDCHSGHVEYDAAGTGSYASPNIYLVRRYLQYTTAGRVSKRILYNSTTTKNYYNATDKGVCQSCHNPPSDHLVGSAVESSHSDCASCHSHNDSAGSFSVSAGGCTSCHGQPPTTKAAGGPTGKAAGYTTFNEYSTPHASHAGGTQYNYTCTECHQGNTHNSGNTFTDVFITKSGIKAGASAAYTSPTCTNVYCHSSGNGTYKGGVNTVAWGNNKNSIIGLANQATRCNTCHDSTTYSTRHTTHVTTFAYGCVTCHTATVSSNTALLPEAKLAGGTHVNGLKDVQFSQVAPAVGATCANVYCHSNGAGVYPAIAPDWATPATGTCNTCHKTATNVSGILSTGAHFTHLSSSFGPKLNNNTLCNNCHVYTGELVSTHVDGTINKNGGGSGSGLTWCQNCHGVSVPTNWAATGTSVTCQSCHSGRGNGSVDIPANRAWSTYNQSGGVQAPFKSYTTFINRGHGQAASPYNGAIDCKVCHDEKSKHMSGALGDSRRLPAGQDTASNKGFVGSNALCDTCHVAGQSAASKVRPTHDSVRNEVSPTMQCAQCHDVHGTTNQHMVARSISFHANSSAYNVNYTAGVFVQTTAPYRGLCQVCHTLTNHFRRGQSNYNIGGGATDHTSLTTNCLSCHPHGAGVSAAGNVAFRPVGGGSCDGCHGYPPVPDVTPFGRQNNYSSAKLENYSGGGGVHAIAGHLPATVKASNGWNSDCNKCHYNTTHSMDVTVWNTGKTTTQNKANVNVVVDPIYQFNTSKTLNEGRYVKPAQDATGSCSNVSCHFKPTPAWSNDK